MTADIDPTRHDLSLMPDEVLLGRLGDLVRDSRRVEAELVAHIGEVDERKLYARFAFSSMYSYCTEALHLTEAEAYRRITVARAARRHEMLLPMLRDGRLHVSGVALLVGLLTPANCLDVLRRATHASRREIERLVAELRPKPDVRAVIRKLPEQPACLDSHGPRALRSNGDCQFVPPAPSTSAAPAAIVEDGSLMSGAPISVDHTQLSPGRAASRPSEVVDLRPAAIQPLSPRRYKVQFTASDELRQKLERLRALMRTEVPSGDLAAIVDKAVTEKLARLQARRIGTAKVPGSGSPRPMFGRFLDESRRRFAERCGSATRAAAASWTSWAGAAPSGSGSSSIIGFPTR